MNRPIKYIAAATVFFLLFSNYGNAQAKGSFEVSDIKSISSASDDMAPVILKDGILFCSNRKTNPFLTRKNLDGIRLFDLYFAPFGSDGAPGKVSRFAPGLVRDANIGPAAVSPDGNRLYFTRNYLEGKKLRKNESNKLGIFIATRNGNQWADIQPFEYNNTEYNLSYPFISNDGRFLFFSSDMPGGEGSYDIYMCENVEGKWSKPVNLGKTVNSSAAEIHPFLHTSGKLYFASDRAGGLGGLDIWSSTLSYGTWENPVHLDEPLNSTADDFALYAEQGGMEGYFTSNRHRFNDDIFRFASTIIRWSRCDTLKKNSYCYEFVEENALKSDTLTMGFKWEWNFGDGQKGEGVTAEHCYAGPGLYDVTLDIVNLITGGVEKRQASYELEVTDYIQPVITSPDTVRSGESFTLSAGESNLPGMNIARYYWNFGDETVSTGTEVTKVFSVPGRYNIQLIVSSVPGQSGVVRELCVCKDIEVIEK